MTPLVAVGLGTVIAYVITVSYSLVQLYYNRKQAMAVEELRKSNELLNDILLELRFNKKGGVK